MDSLFVLRIAARDHDLSRPKIAVAHVLGLGWCATFFWYYSFAGSGITWGYAVQDAAIASYFWRQSQRAAFPAPLFFIHFISIIYYFLSTLTRIDDWWTAVIANRLFEIALAYVAGCAIFRIVKLRKKNMGAPAERPRRSGKSASYSNSFAHRRGWRLFQPPRCQASETMSGATLVASAKTICS